MAQTVADAFATQIPARAYRGLLTGSGALQWVAALSLLPIECLL